MAQTVNRLKANRVLEGRPCGWCSSALSFGDDAALCESCTTGHHASCWNGKGGCSSPGCVNAPLKQLAHEPQDLDSLNDLRHGTTDWIVGRALGGGRFEPVASGTFPKKRDGTWSLALPAGR